MIKLRKLTDKESRQFRRLCERGDLLNSDLDVNNFTSGAILADIEIDPDRKFNNKLELGAYLYEKLGGASFYIDPQKPYYPFTHLLKPVFDLYGFYDGEKTLIDFLLLNPVNESGRLFSETVKRQNLLRNENFIRASKNLFFDEGEKKIKTGIQDDFLRLIALWQQYERTYDLYSMPAERILQNLIGKHDEFASYISTFH